jgi:translation initiation factor IF-3
MDYGKYKYEAAQKAKEARKNQANTILKEVRFRLKIDTHDYETKRKRAESFLQAGDKVKAMILFRGREQSRPEQGVRLLQRFAEDVAHNGVVEFTPTIDGRNMVMIIAPLKSKADAKAAQAKAKTAKPARETEPVAVLDEVASAAQAPAAAKTPAAKVPVAKEPAAKATVSKAPVSKAPAAAKAPAVAKVPAAKAPAATRAPKAAPKTTTEKKEETDA